MTDEELASSLAHEAAALLLEVRDDALDAGEGPMTTGRLGDGAAHDFLVARLAEERPDDAVLSEEGVDDVARLDVDRLWIIDPLDGSRQFSDTESVEWAVHVALCTSGEITASAVSLPARGLLFSSAVSPSGIAIDRERPSIIANRSTAGRVGRHVANELGADLAACGSSGVKAMAVVSGEFDIYVHGTGLYEWDACAPAGVAAACGLWVSDAFGDAIEYNKVRPVVHGLVICRPEFAEPVLAALA